MINPTLATQKHMSDDGCCSVVAEVIYGNRRICDGSTLDDVLGPSAHITWMVDCAPAPGGMVACGGFECRIGSGVKCEVQAYLEIGD